MDGGEFGSCVEDPRRPVRGIFKIDGAAAARVVAFCLRGRAQIHACDLFDCRSLSPRRWHSWTIRGVPFGR